MSSAQDSDPASFSSAPHSRMVWLLLFSVAVIATCGLIYELIAGTLASYLLGDSVTQFSTVIGVYLFSMGIGSWVSKYITRRVIETFIQVELLIGLAGGCSAALLFILFGSVDSFRALLYSLVVLIGALVGMEIPLLLRLLKDRLEFKELVARVLSLDYVGALIASIMFPLLLVPHLGLMRSSFLFGFLNAAVGLVTILALRKEIGWWRGLMVQALLVLTILGSGFVYADRLLDWSERGWYAGENILFSRSSPYQRLVLTRQQEDLRLYLNGNLQFSSRDEYRYHESLVHPALSRMAPGGKKVLVLGGGDGLALREILKHPQIEHITLVDLDPAMTELFTTHPLLTTLNKNSLTSPKVLVVNADAFTWLENAREQAETFDAAIIDFPDPSNFSLGKLYTNTFYKRLLKVLKPEAVFAVQTTSPLFARESFWCVDATLRSCGLLTLPYHTYVPSFGEWGFVMGSLQPLREAAAFPSDLRFLTEEGFALMKHFPPDMAQVDAEINKLNNQALVRTFDREWSRYTN